MLSAFSQNRTRLYLFLVLISFYGTNIFSDSPTYNSYNNHGGIGLINMPTARFYDEASHGITLFNGTPDQKITFTHLLMTGLKLLFSIRILRDYLTVHLKEIQFALRTIRIKVLILK